MLREKGVAVGGRGGGNDGAHKRYGEDRIAVDHYDVGEASMPVRSVRSQTPDKTGKAGTNNNNKGGLGGL